VSEGLPTVRAARAARRRVVVRCLECDDVRDLNLRAFAASRLADTPLAKLPLRCRPCGSRAFRVVVSGAVPR
jgi:hypothetical protein